MLNRIRKILKFPIFLFYYSKSKQEGGKENFGDILSLYLVKKISIRRVIVINPLSFIFRKILKHYFVIGSIISKANKNSIVWGSGIIRANDNIKGGKFIAVRGPLTRNRILNLGFQCDEIYGDPAILTPFFYNPPLKKEKKLIGVIPHYVDFSMIYEVFKNKSEFKIINLLNNNVETVIDEIISCNKIISSSLHGIIIGQSFGIPSIWVRFSDKLVGDDIKFYDYFESMGISYNKIFELNDCENIDLLFRENGKLSLPEKKMIKYRQEILLNSCPF